MKNEVQITQEKMNSELRESLSNASAIITKDYLEELEKYEIVKPTYGELDINIVKCGKFYKLTKLVLNREENFLNKLTTIVNVASSVDCSLTTIIRSDGSKVDYYFGIISKKARTDSDVERRNANAAAFHGALTGNLTGSELEEMLPEDVEVLKNTVLGKKENSYSAVSGIVALRDEEDKSVEGYVQGIENLVDSLKGQKYTIVMLADSVSMADIQGIKEGYEMLHTQLSTFARSSVTIHESDTLSLAKARTEGISKGISHGIALTQSKTRSEGNYFGGGASLGISFGISASVGFNAGKNSSTADTNGKTETDTETTQTNESETNSTSSAKTGGRSLQLSYENRAVKALLDKIDKHLERLDECSSFGAFDCAAYIIAGNRETALTVASNYNALMRGKNSSIQASHINSWDNPDQTKMIAKYIGALVHPRFYLPFGGKTVSVTPASVISGEELAIQIGLPKKSVSGITVIPMAPFGRNVLENNRKSIMLGNLYHMGHEEGRENHPQKVSVDMESLSMHTFITGSTGAGKTTAIYSMLDKLREQSIKFMVIEPAKGEYKDRFGCYPDVKVYGTNYKKMPLLKINPFSFPEDIHVLEHIDRLIEIFNVCWPMYAAMPAVLKDAIERAYIVSGWNLETSECKYQDADGKPLFPLFVDVLRQIYVVMEESAYSADSKGDYKGALCTRLKSLTNGLYGQIFTNDELSAEELFDNNVIVDLSRTGSSETKSLIMGLLVMKLQEHRMANTAGGNAPLRHVTVLEEAHNILKRTSTEQSAESANLLGKSVEMLANSIAEMRTYGEGFIIADQAPGLLDKSVIRNTNTKIILRLPDLEDRELVGRAASLNDDQILELSRLQTFVAAVYQNNWLEPVLCKIDTNFKEISWYEYSGSAEREHHKEKVIEFLLLPIEKRNQLDSKYISELADEVFKLQLPAEAKVAFLKYTQTFEKDEIQRLRGEVLYHIFNTGTAFGMARSREGNLKSWYEYMKAVLEPDITVFTENDQKKILAVLSREQAELGGKESRVLFESLMDYF